jgi:hypothetical protein
MLPSAGIGTGARRLWWRCGRRRSKLGPACGFGGRADPARLPVTDRPASGSRIALGVGRDTVLLRAQFGRQGLAEIAGLEHRADLDFALFVVRIGAALDPVDRCPSGDSVAEPASDPPEAAAPPGAVGREQVLAAFARNRTPASPEPAAPQPRPPERPWFVGPKAPQPKSEMTEEAWEELISGFVAGNVNWNARRLGPEPGNPGCRAPQSVLRRYRL